MQSVVFQVSEDDVLWWLVLEDLNLDFSDDEGTDIEYVCKQLE